MTAGKIAKHNIHDMVSNQSFNIINRDFFVSSRKKRKINMDNI